MNDTMNNYEKPTMTAHDQSEGETTVTDERSTKTVLARANDLQLHFDTERGVVKALDGVSFDVYEGETLALVGETGCGKTVTARSFMQLVPTPPGRYVGGEAQLRSDRDCPDCGGAGCPECHGSGEAFDDVLSMSQKEMQRLRGKRLAMVFQDPQTALNPSLPIIDQVAESVLAHQIEEVLDEVGVAPDGHGRVTYGLLRREASPRRSLLSSVLTALPPLRGYRNEIRSVIRQRVLDVLRETNIPNPREILNKYPHELSGGMKQRVMISMALVSKPDLLIADEPTTALDVTTQARILEMIGDLQDEYNTSLLYITHDLSLVEDIADRVAVMYAGSVAEIGEVDGVFQNPLHPYTRGLIDSIPDSSAVDEPLRGIDGSIPDLTNPPEGCRFCTRCPDVMDHCSDVDPPMVEEEPNHTVTCHLYPDETEVDSGEVVGKPGTSDTTVADSRGEN